MRASKWLCLMAGATLAMAAGVQAQPVVHHTTTHHTTTRHTAKRSKARVTSGPPSVQQVLQLFQVIHVDDALRQMNTQMAHVMAEAVPCVPAAYWEGFIDAGSTREVLDRMVPVYQRHFTEGEVDGLVRFYRSPLGQKVLTVMPETMAEAAKVGQQWGVERRQDMLGELQRQGKLDGQGRCPADPAVGSSIPKLAVPATVPQPARAASTAAPPGPGH